MKENFKKLIFTVVFTLIGFIPATVNAAHDRVTGKPTDLNNTVYLAINNGDEFPGEPVIYDGSSYSFINSRFQTTSFSSYASKASSVLKADILDDVTEGTPDGSTKVWGVYSPNALTEYLVNGSSNPILTNENKIIQSVLGSRVDPEDYKIVWYVIKYQTNTGWHIDGIIKKVDTYAINYYGNGNTFGGAPSGQKDINTGESYTILGNTGNLGKEVNGTVYRFMGWSENPNATTAQYQAGDVIDSVNRNISLYAVWSADISYIGKVYFKIDDEQVNVSKLHGSNSEVYVKTADGDYIKLNETSDGGYQAELKNGEYTVYIKKNDEYVNYDEHKIIISNKDSNITFNHYTVRYDANGGTFKNDPGVETYHMGSTVKATTEVPKKQGYKFIGWEYNDKTYGSGKTVTSDIRNKMTLTAVWEKVINVTVNVTIDHQTTIGYDRTETKDDLKLELLRRENTTTPYIETGKYINFSNSGVAGFNYLPQYISGSEESEENVLVTKYIANTYSFAELESSYDYTILTSKSSYDVISIDKTVDEDGNITIDVKLKYTTENFDIKFEVKMDKDVPKELYPVAAIVKVEFWAADRNRWEVITQQAGNEPGVRVEIDPTTGIGYGSYPVWKFEPDGDPYGYRIIITSYVYENNKIVKANKDTKDGNIIFTDGNYTGTIGKVNDGKEFGTELNGAYYDETTDSQIGTLDAIISVEKYNVTFDAQGGKVNSKNEETVKDLYYVPTFDAYQPTRENYEFMGWYLEPTYKTKATEKAFLTEDITLYAKWKAIQTIKGTLTFAGTYMQDGQVVNVWPADRAKQAKVILQEITKDGVYTIATQVVNITWNEATKIGTSEEYIFENLDEDKKYRVDVILINYTTTYQNESTVTTDDGNISNDYNTNDYDAEFISDRTETFVNMYLVFDAEEYYQKVEVNTQHISESFRPNQALVDILYKLNTEDNDKYNVISQHTVSPFGLNILINTLNGLSEGEYGEYIWKSLYDGVPYVYMARLKTLIFNGNSQDYNDELPYYITQTVSRWDPATHAPTNTLLITVIPKVYNIFFDLNTTDAVKGMEDYLQGDGTYLEHHTWSYETIIKAKPTRKGYNFMGWKAMKDGVYIDGIIGAGVAEDVTLVAQWSKKENLSYTVEYLEKDTNNKLNKEKVVDKQTFGNEVTENAITITGYNLVSAAQVTITIDEENNKIIFYYEKKKDLSYTVNYIDKETGEAIAPSKNVANQTFGDKVTERAEVIPGYNLGSEKEQTITIKESGNEITFYYTKKDDLIYKVEYLEKDTNIKLHDDKIVTRQVFGDVVTENAVTIKGYNLVGNSQVTITIDETKQVITFYYEKKSNLSYTVEYLEKDTNNKLSKDRVVDKQTFGNEVTENAITITGYNLVSAAQVTITIDEENNKIIFYYEKKKDLSYTVNYIDKETGEAIVPSKNVTNKTFGDKVTERAEVIPGYNLGSEKEQTITIKESGNEITFYYTKKTDLSYRVEYLEKDTNIKLHDDKIVTRQVFGDVVTENAVTIKGYNLVGNSEVTITIDETKQVITFYYEKKKDLSYVVNYLENLTDKVLHTQKVVNNMTYGSEVTESFVPVPGYNIISAKSVKIVIDEENNVINFYYKKKDNLSYTVEYLEKGTNIKLSADRIVENQIFSSTVTEIAPTIKGYNLVSDEKVSIIINETNNKITFYYEKKNDLTYKVEYLEKDTNIRLHDDKIVTRQVFGDVVTENAVTIKGYNLVGESQVTITIDETKQVITFYYEKKNDLSYVVNYLENLTEKVLHTQKVVNNMTYGSEVTESYVTVPGYNIISAKSVKIVIDEENNIINFYYKKKDNLSYTVEYLEKGTNIKLSPDKVIENQIFSSTVTEIAPTIKGYNLVSDEKVSIIINETNNKITFLYEKKSNLSYIVKYIDKEAEVEIIPSKNVTNQTFGDKVTERAEVIPGYYLGSEKEQSITIKEEGNVIIFYYEKKKDLIYKVEYLEQGTNKKLSSDKVMFNQVFGTEITENAITIKGYNLVGESTIKFVVDETKPVVTFYYTKKSNLSYVVEYLEKGTNNKLSADKVVNNQVFGSNVIEQAITIEGYNLVGDSKVTITIDEENNKITFLYTKKNDLSYKVNYLEKGTNKVLSPAKNVTNMTFKDEVTESAITIKGYNLVGNANVTITINETNNEITFYYEKKTDLTYIVEYLEQGTNNKLSADKIVDKQIFASEVTENAITITGYNLVGEATKSIIIDEENNKITFLYEKKSNLSYKVNYVDKETGEAIAQSKNVANQTFGDKVTESAITIPGYNLGSDRELSITIKESGNEITFYYIKKKDLTYKVEYLEKGTNKKLSSDKVLMNQVFGTEITENAITIKGYNLVSEASKTITINEEKQIITFLYEKKNNLSYVVNYLENLTDKVLSPAKTVNNMTFGSEVTESAITIPGYNVISAKTVKIVIDEENNVINFYYKKKSNLTYIVEYLEKGTNIKLSPDKVVNNQIFASEVIENAITIKGYNLIGESTKSIIINEENNKITYYYEKKSNLSYVVEYLEKGTNNKLSADKVVNDQVFGSEVIENAITIKGYNLIGEATKTITIDETNNKITYYYEKKNDLNYTVNYLEKGTDKVLSPSKNVANMTFASEVTEKAITIKGYNLVSAKEVTITIDENNNVITFYYEKKTDLSYKVQYLEEGTNNKLSEDKVVTGQTFGYTVTEDAITINGYNLVGANQVTITIDEKDNVITFYYTKKTGLNYTVQYLEKDTNNKLSDDKVVNNLVFGTTITENAIDIVGYELDGEVEVTITINETNNVITYYYVKKNINYTIEYYYDDVKDASKTEVLSAPYLSTITTYTDKLIDGYAFDFVLGLPLTIGVDPEDNVIKVYYATDVLRDADKTTDPTDKDGEGSDGIPDKYQKTVIFKVENGLWNDGTNKDIVLIVTLTKDGNNDTTGSANITIPTNMVALKGFVGGAWDKQPSETVYGTNEEVYTYTFDLINKNPQTGDEVNGWIALMISSLSGSIGLTYYSRKKENM